MVVLNQLNINLYLVGIFLIIVVYPTFLSIYDPMALYYPGNALSLPIDCSGLSVNNLLLPPEDISNNVLKVEENPLNDDENNMLLHSICVSIVLFMIITCFNNGGTVYYY